MRIALLGNAESIHTVKWVNGLAARGHQVNLISQEAPAEHRIDDAVTVHRLRHGGGAGYFRNARQVHRLLGQLDVDVVNAHYATGYGTLLNLARTSTPTVLNVWGSDVLEVPHRSALHREWVKWNLRRVTRVAATSHAMASEIAWLLDGRVPDITPFGVDVERFSPGEAPAREAPVVGTVKKLDPVYGIDTLLAAFAQLPSATRLVIAGSGPQEAELKALAASLGVADRVEFLGQIANDAVPDVLRGLDVFVALSRRESFGVAILEAGACGVPVVVSNASGPAEVVVAGETGEIVPIDDAEAAAKAIAALLGDRGLAARMGAAGRDHAVANYSWERCLEIMEGVYERAASGERN